MIAALVDLLPAGGDWRELGLCQQVDSELFFPDKGGTSQPAKQVCGACEVRPQCLEFALAHDERFGIWGGLSERERRRLKRAEAAASGKPGEDVPGEDVPGEDVPGEDVPGEDVPAARVPGAAVGLAGVPR